MSHFAVAVLTPSTGICRIEYAQSLARMVAYFAQHPIFDGVEQTITTDAISGSSIGGNYQVMIDKYLKDENTYWTHFLSIEDDMFFPPDGLHTLARHQLDIVGANYSVNKGRPLRFTATNGDTPVITGPDSTGLEEVKYLPQGFTLVRREVYEKLEKPWFLNGYNVLTENYVCQDYYFSDRARENGFKLHVDHDVSKQIVHVGIRNYSFWDAYAAVEAAGEQDGDIGRSVQREGDLVGSAK